MAEFIELVCACGKKLKVPKSRAGQTGKCARCKQPVVIPAIASDDAVSSRPSLPKTAPFKSASLISPGVKKSLDLISQTHVRPQSAAASFPGDSPKAAKAIDNRIYGRQPVANLPGRQKRQQETSQLCSSCGHLNAMAAVNCERCREPLRDLGGNTKKRASASQKQSKTRKREPGKTKSKTTKTEKNAKAGFSPISLFWLMLLAFLVGLVAGILISPGYYNFIPDKNALLEKIKRLSPSVSSGSQKNGSNSPATNAIPPKSQQEKHQLRRQIEKALASVEIYLAVLDREYSQLKTVKKQLDARYQGIYLPDIEQTISLADKTQRALQSRVRYAKNAVAKQENLQQAYDKLKPSSNLDSESFLISQLRKASTKLAQELQRLDSYSKNRQPPEANCEYLGPWYPPLQERSQFLEKLCAKEFAVENTGAALRLQKLQNSLKIVRREYPGDIYRAGKILQEAMKKKDVKAWIKMKKEAALTSSQLDQARILYNFLKNGYKFQIDIAKELDELSREVPRFEREINRGRIREVILKDLLSVFQRIHKKYRENYIDFNSAVDNFHIWRPR